MVYHTAVTLKPNLADRSADAAECVVLVGAGVVGRAILAEHLRQRFNVLLLDVSEAALQRAVDETAKESDRGLDGLQTCRVDSPLPGLTAMRLGRGVDGQWDPQLLIESIPENLELKQSFFATASAVLPATCILGSNTSNLRVAEIFKRVGHRSNCLGIHFFMPVGQRPLIELIPCQTTEPGAVQFCREHAGRLGKDALMTRDSPGFVVNRLLAPYLNQSLLLLGRGAAPELIAAAAKRFGMPLSPLELIDLIGIRTAFDSGRVFWRSFPKRIDPAPILPGMIKAGRLGYSFGGGFYDVAAPSPQSDWVASTAAESTQRRHVLHPDAIAVIDRYQRDVRPWTEPEVLASLSLPMWIEAAEILAAEVVDSFEAIELALRGGLGFRGTDGFFALFDRQGGAEILSRLDAAAGEASHAAPPLLCDQLRLGSTPSEAIKRYVEHVRRLTTVAAAGAKL
jgi:3-hydroxyacyl-CoA dehydrogenase / enoyl-CoA hydratase / 3-hydroxybutyryl-CoA epimerase / enoyl-CoA isomerase